jgi:choline dehydrogenase-like flavoprotein
VNPRGEGARDAVFDARERAILRALGEVALPGGTVLASPGEATYRRMERFFATGAASVAQGYRALLWSLELQTLARTGTRFSAQSAARRLDTLDAWSRSELLRVPLRGLLVPLKLAYFDDPQVYAAIGCRYGVETPAALEPARWRRQIGEAGALADGETLECDVVVVGTGAGGAPLAKVLAERGHAVLLLEEGRHLTRLDFDGRPLSMMKKAYRQGGLTVAYGNTAIPIPVGMAVGGSTLINSGTCLRAPAQVFAEWRDSFGITGLDAATIAPHYDAVESFLGVGPSSASALGRPAQVIARGCDALGYAHHALPRNAPGCDGQGLCCFGCPTDAKRSTNVSWIPAALGAGAQLLTGFTVERVLTADDGETAVGVIGTARGPQGSVNVTVRARVVVLACGALQTPLVLLRSGLANASGEVGRNLSIHPASSAIGVFDDDLEGWRSVPQGYAIDEFRDEGLLFEGAHAPLDVTAATLTTFGPQFTALMEDYRRTVGFGFMIRDRSRGRVTPSEDGNPRLSYWLGRDDLRRMQRGYGLLARVFFAAGARAVYPAVAGHERLASLADVDALERADLAARHLDISAYHPLGTCRMGRDPRRSVVDATHETHDVHNLFVCDGSALPGAPGVNPQLTIMAMSLRAAGFVERRLEALRARAA